MQGHEIHATGHRRDLGDAIDVDERPSPQPNEPVGIEPRLEIFQTIGDRVALVAGRREVKQLAVSDDADDVLDVVPNDVVACVGPECVRRASAHARSYCATACFRRVAADSRSSARFEPIVRALQRFPQTRLVDRLQEIVDRVDLERLAPRVHRVRSRR